MIKELAYAKINLALEVMDNVDGYHMVNNLMIPISLYDELIFEIADDIFVINSDIMDNICIKAAQLFINKYNISSGVKITLNKNIPTSAGLAGGSSDAAAVLKGLNKLFNVNANNDELRALAELLGSDVPFFIEPGLSLCTNRGEKINKLSIDVNPIKLLIIKPKEGLSTKAIYQAYKYKGIDRKDNFKNIYKALENNDIALLEEAFFNDLNEYSLIQSKELRELYSMLKDLGLKPHISGSGPSIFIINPSDNDINNIKNIIPNDTFIRRCETLKM